MPTKTPAPGAERVGTSSRARLLAAAIDHVAAHGWGDLSLRGLAAAIGTSHRMLIYHFGSKEGLLVEVCKTVEQRQREMLTELETDPDVSPTDVARRFWDSLTDPSLAPFERLFFELYGQALQGRPGTEELLDNVVDSWLDVYGPSTSDSGVDRRTGRIDVRLGVAVARGLLLDLLATGDKRAVDAAMSRFIDAYETVLVRDTQRRSRRRRPVRQ